ncbi:MAG: ROK family protein [Actinobacteria bacterium]|nr:ROK family protein [Actinomycetota bacterium]
MTSLEPMTLSIDCGGLSLKASVLDSAGTLHAQPISIPTPYPLSPERLIQAIEDLSKNLPRFDRITVGMPGMIRHGVVVNTPHYINTRGPRTRLDPALLGQWRGFDMQSAISDHLKKPTLVLNDAEVHGAGLVNGSGLEVVITLGTGLGFSIFDGGKLAPHIELSHAPIRRGTSYDTWVGEHERRRLGDSFWSRRIRLMVEDLRPVFCWDRLYIGGGNSRRIRSAVLQVLGDDVVIASNTAGILGGVRAWKLVS